MKLEVGMYVRFDCVICKILEIEDGYIEFDTEFYDHWHELTSSIIYDRFINDYKPKASYDILELIEVGDYVNGLKITTIDEDHKWVYAEDEEGYLLQAFYKYDIKSIVTKEQMESMSYKVGE